MFVGLSAWLAKSCGGGRCIQTLAPPVGGLWPYQLAVIKYGLDYKKHEVDISSVILQLLLSVCDIRGVIFTWYMTSNVWAFSRDNNTLLHSTSRYFIIARPTNCLCICYLAPWSTSHIADYFSICRQAFYFLPIHQQLDRANSRCKIQIIISLLFISLTYYINTECSSPIRYFFGNHH